MSAFGGKADINYGLVEVQLSLSALMNLLLFGLGDPISQPFLMAFGCLGLVRESGDGFAYQVGLQRVRDHLQVKHPLFLALVGVFLDLVETVVAEFVDADVADLEVLGFILFVGIGNG